MPRFNPLFLVALALSTPLFAADDESRPKLVSTTGGGTSWSNPKELQKDADLGKPAALAAYGEMLIMGNEQVPKDIPHGLEMLDRAAKAGQTTAAFRLGKVYDDGEITARDAAKAVEYYKQAALAGVSEAQYNLGALYMNGRGIKRDYKEGLAWLTVARKNGAEPSTEQQVRQRFQSTHREQIIAAADARADEITAEIAKGRAATTADSSASK